MSYWEGPARWINTILLVVVGLIGFDTLFQLLEANESNVIVGFVRAGADWLLAPFEDMFPDQEYLLTALIAVLGYSLLAGILLAIVRSVQASRRPRIVEHDVVDEGPLQSRGRRATSDPDRTRPVDRSGRDADRTQQL